jgi:hypothetical protein
MVNANEFQTFLRLDGMNQTQPKPLPVETEEWADLKFQGRGSWGILRTKRIHKIKDIVASLLFPSKDLLLTPAQGALSRANATMATSFAGVGLPLAHWQALVWS